MNIRPLLYGLLYLLFLLSCAKQTAPTGGPRDTIPPSLVSSRPLSQQTNYTTPTLELTFDEQLILNNPKEQIIITPDLGNTFLAQTKKHNVSIKFESPFAPNTTYSINFRDAIQDITEKNPAENLKLAFSTGDYIDSLSIEGIVYDLLKSVETKDATVALYQSDTFDIFRHKPIYFTKTDTKGKFQLTNLKPGQYYIYALDDKNKNLVVESKSESYGFFTKSIKLNHDTTNIRIPLVRLDARPLKLTSARPSGTYYNIKTSKSLANYQLTEATGKQLYSSFGEDPANVRIYNTLNLKDSLLIRFRSTDSISNAIDTTLYLKYSPRAVTPEKFQATNSKFRLIASKGILSGTISFNKPLLSINYDSIYYQVDSLRIIPITEKDIQIDTANNQLKIFKTFPKEILHQPVPAANKTNNTKINRAQPNQASGTQKKKTDYQIYLSKGTLLSVEGDSSARIATPVTPTSLENSGTISVNISTRQDNFIVQLLTKDYQIISTAINQKNPTFEDLDPGDYRLRLIIDENQDHQWNPGNYHLHEQPEPAIFYKNEKESHVITLKANWELGPLLITY